MWNDGARKLVSLLLGRIVVQVMISDDDENLQGSHFRGIILPRNSPKKAGFSGSLIKVVGFIQLVASYNSYKYAKCTMCPILDIRQQTLSYHAEPILHWCHLMECRNMGKDKLSVKWMVDDRALLLHYCCRATGPTSRLSHAISIPIDICRTGS